MKKLAGKRTQRALAAIALAGFFGSAGCDTGSTVPASAACVEAGAQCQLGGGPLGVCERAACAAGETEPCFRCIPQH